MSAADDQATATEARVVPVVGDGDADVAAVLAAKRCADMTRRFRTDRPVSRAGRGVSTSPRLWPR